MTRQRVALVGGTSKGLVLDLIRSRGPVSRVDLAEATGLTQATMSTVVRQLIDDGLVAETGRGESTGGKPPVLLDINRASRFAVGVQLGSESITYIVANLSGAVVGRIRTEGVGTTTPDEMVAAIAAVIGTTLDGLGIEKSRVVGVGVVAPGPIDVERGVLLGPPRLATWNDVMLRALLTDTTGLPVVLENDATAAALGEFWSGTLGSARAHATVFMGAGIGAGIVVGGAIYRGASSNAAELGQFPIVGEARGEGGVVSSRLVLEDVASPPAVVAAAKARGIEIPGMTGTDDFTDFKAIATAAVRGDESAISLIQKSADYLTTAVITLANFFDLDSISLAGPSFSIAGSLYASALTDRLNDEFFSRENHGIVVRLSPHTSDAAAVGGAALILQTELAPRTLSGLPAVG